MDRLKRSKDRKVANSLRPSGGVRIANSIGLPSGKAYSCPGATSVCERICYAGRIEKQYKETRAVLLHNWSLLKDADIDTMVDLLDDMVTEFEAECEKFKAEKLFRIHWDGDFFNRTYTMAWANIIARHPSIRFWVYTRTADSAEYLQGQSLANLSLYFSSDSVNMPTANILKERGIKLAVLADTFEEARESSPRAAMCPELRKQIPLNGACTACKICIKGEKDILFSITKR